MTLNVTSTHLELLIQNTRRPYIWRTPRSNTQAVFCETLKFFKVDFPACLFAFSRKLTELETVKFKKLNLEIRGQERRRFD